MTARKAELAPKNRPAALVSREVGAGELCVSPTTWDDMVASGELPPPHGYVRGEPRWRWIDIERAIANSRKPVEASELIERIRQGTRKELAG